MVSGTTATSGTAESFGNAILGTTNGKHHRNGNEFRRRWRSKQGSGSESRSFQMTGGGSERSSLTSGKHRSSKRLEVALYQGLPTGEKTFRERQTAASPGTRSAKRFENGKRFVTTR